MRSNSGIASVVRCAIYTRVSTSEQADLEYSSLDAQRETGEAYVASQKHAGWTTLDVRYDDGGFTGANTERPAFQQLMDDIQAGKIDCVVTYKLDRLTRSLADFARTLETFEKHNVAIVSVTQAFDTSTATGKLMMHILMSFAEFERQLISERTRDKIAATRRRGKWSGGMPVLGYDLVDSKLVILDDEADRVREIFEMYLNHGSLTSVANELEQRGWRTKQWTTKKNGELKGGNPFVKTNLHSLLTNPVYIGKVRYKGEAFDGEHEPIIAASVFERVQKKLAANGTSGGRKVRNKTGALLRGLVRCKNCGCAMSHSFSTKGNRRYRYYTCVSAQKRGWNTCPQPSLPAVDLERFVVDQIREFGRDPDIVREALAAVRRETEKRVKRQVHERITSRRKMGELEAKVATLATANLPEEVRFQQIAETQDEALSLRNRLTEIETEMAKLDEDPDENELVEALADFDVVWESLKPVEQTRVVELLIQSVEYDAASETLAVEFSPLGNRIFADTQRENVA